MSLFANSVLRSCFCYNTHKLPIRTISTAKVNYLYSQSALGIDKYIYGRKKIKEQFSNFSERFRAKMMEFANDPKSMIFTEDLKNMIHLAEPSDLELVVKMLNKPIGWELEARIYGYYCICIVGKRIIGTCAVWYLGWERYQQNITPPASFHENVLVREDTEYGTE